MNAKGIQEWFAQQVAEGEGNVIDAEWALSPDMVGERIFASPLVGVASASDPLFKRIHDEDVVLGPTFRLPNDWLEGAKSIISIFYPFSEDVRKSNYGNLGVPSGEWLHGRIEGHDFIHATDRKFAALLESRGAKTAIPALDPSLVINKREPEDAVGRPMFVSGWSERHVAWTCGLGTFGLCTHLITAKGKAGRFGSIITDLEIEPTPRPYGDDPFAYCTRCGACTAHCPVDALTLEGGKDFQTCWRYLEDSKIRFKPRYGCGKCQLEVPCETGIPNPAYR